MKTKYLLGYCFLLSIFVLGCKNPKDEKTSLEVIDNNRHYYPLRQGQELLMTFGVKNSGQHPFILEDVITSCGCVIIKESAISSIPVGREAKVQVTYDSTKNIGHVKHYITLYGNLEHQEFVELVFDVNVIPDAHYTKDYEELYQEKESAKSKWERIMEDKPTGQKYYLDDTF